MCVAMDGFMITLLVVFLLLHHLTLLFLAHLMLLDNGFDSFAAENGGLYVKLESVYMMLLVVRQPWTQLFP
jgi:hypothetical protein